MVSRARHLRTTPSEQTPSEQTPSEQTPSDPTPRDPTPHATSAAARAAHRADAVPAQALEVVRGADRAALLLHKTRRQLLAALHEPDSAAGLARKLGVPRQRLNYHLHQLEQEGLIELVEERRKGNCVERVVRATARAYVISPEALGVLGDSGATADRFSSAYLMTAAANTLRDVAALAARGAQENKRLATLAIEADVRFASAETRAAFADELAAALAALVAKYHDEHAANGRRFHLLTAVHPAVRKP